MAYDYRQPIPPLAAREHLGAKVNAGYGWNWKAKDRITGVVGKYFTRSSYGSKADLIDHVSRHYPGLDFVDGAEADKEPGEVFPMPPRSFQRPDGLMQKVVNEIAGNPAAARSLLRLERSVLRTLPIPAPIRRATMPTIPRNLIPRKTLSR